MISITPLRFFQDLFFAGQAFAHLKGKILQPGELLEYPLVMASAGSSFAINLSNWFAQQGYTLNPQIQVMTTAFVQPFVEMGFAIGCAPENFVRRWTEQYELFPLQLTTMPPPRQLFLAINREVPLSTAARCFASMIATA